MQKINFNDATLLERAYVTIDGQKHYVTEATYSDGTDLDANTFNTMQNNIEDAISEIAGEKYSNDEKVIGTWTNGKPLYRKVVEFTRNTGVFEDNIEHGISGVDKFIPTSAIMIKRADGGDTPLPFSYAENEASLLNYSGGWRIDRTHIRTTIGVSLRNGMASSNNCTAILEYTKITD